MMMSALEILFANMMTVIQILEPDGQVHWIAVLTHKSMNATATNN